MTYIKREILSDPNYKRYYQVSDHVDICNGCPAKSGTDNWDLIYEGVKFKPVDTNWPEEPVLQADKIVICESPSNEETSYGVPSVGATGRGIYKKILKQEIEKGWLDKLDKLVYRTNIVRCQADAGIKGNYKLKNHRVRDAWCCCSRHLEVELEKILSNFKAEELIIYVAIGGDFPRQKEKAMEIINDLVNQKGLKSRVKIEELNHPSSR